MITDELKNWKSIPGMVDHPVWFTAFNWIEDHAASAGLGFHELGIDGVKVRVMEYDLKERDFAKWEAHRKTIDLQYTIEGAEGIEVNPVSCLESKGDYVIEKDAQYFHQVGKARHRVNNVAGNFCILLPQDGHMPQLSVNGYTHVKKLVVKIPVSAVS